MSKNLKEELMEAIKEKRDKLSDSSAKTYVSLLSTMMKKLEWENKADLENEKKISEYVSNLPSLQTKKTLLSAVFIITGNETLRKQMIDLANESNKIYKENTVSDKRKQQYQNVTEESIRQIYETKLQNVKKSPSPINYVQYFISAVCSGVLFPVRRLEWCYVKTKNYIDGVDNYIDFKKKQFVFNKYKTFKTHGRQTVSIEPTLLKYLKAWVKINESEYLLVKSNGKPYSPSDLSKELLQMFGAGIDILRSLYVNKIYGDALPKLQALEGVANAMGHTVNSALTFYRKPDVNN